jgi:hypothetical protein
MSYDWFERSLIRYGTTRLFMFAPLDTRALVVSIAAEETLACFTVSCLLRVFFSFECFMCTRSGLRASCACEIGSTALLGWVLRTASN